MRCLRNRPEAVPRLFARTTARPSTVTCSYAVFPLKTFSSQAPVSPSRSTATLSAVAPDGANQSRNRPTATRRIALVTGRGPPMSFPVDITPHPLPDPLGSDPSFAMCSPDRQRKDEATLRPYPGKVRASPAPRRSEERRHANRSGLSPGRDRPGTPGRVKAFARAAEDLGYAHLLAYDHVLGAGVRNRPDFRGPYTSESLFHEVFVLFGYLAGITERLELVSGVIILPQRQTVLVAKQAAEVDVLSGGRLRLGIGVGWNDVEYTGLNENFRNRGRRCEEQIALMRALWTDEVVDFDGLWHRVPEAGINPLPVQRPIPVWIGGYVAATMERIGRMGDGWFPESQDSEAPGAKVKDDLEQIARAARAAGRDPAETRHGGAHPPRPGTP